jgi:hypothetical protein
MFGQMRMGRISAKASREVATKGRSKNRVAINSIEELNKILAGPHKHVLVLFTATESDAQQGQSSEGQGDRRSSHFGVLPLSRLCL